jgi:2-polyprenyl-6-methoxyphenol hydroxylase-like FAD-dependent oxidoreductase
VAVAFDDLDKKISCTRLRNRACHRRRRARGASERPAPWTPSRVTVLGDAVHGMPPTGGNGASTALRDAALLTRQLTRTARGELPLLDAIGKYEAEMREYGFEAVDLAMKTLRQGLASNAVEVFFNRNWFRLCSMAAPVRRMTFSSWAEVSAPRDWERTVNTPARAAP